MDGRSNSEPPRREHGWWRPLVGPAIAVAAAATAALLIVVGVLQRT